MYSILKGRQVYFLSVTFFQFSRITNDHFTKKVLRKCSNKSPNYIFFTPTALFNSHKRGLRDNDPNPHN